MLRGSLGGFLTGAILSVLVLGAASVLTDIPGQPPPEASDVDVPAGSEFSKAREDREADLPRGDDAPAPQDAPQVAPPEPDDLASLEGADTAPAAQPETGEAETELAAPQDDGAGESGVNVDSGEPVLPSPQALAPEAPESEPGASISTEPAQPVQPDVEADSGMPGGEDATGQNGAPEAEAPSAPGAGEDTAETGAAQEPEPDAAGDAETAAQKEDVPTGTIGDIAENVTTDRLPTVADEDGRDETGPPPLEKFAAAFENPEDKPLMSIVLIDDGSSPISLEALADFPYPISYAIDADWSGAAKAAREYRMAGLEVVAMADLPPGAGAADTEVAMQAYLEAVPEAVAVMEGTDTGLQGNRAAVEQLIPILEESGHGLLLFSDGLDTAQKLVSREGVPAVTIFRDFDGEGQTATVIRRFLDQAAFKAGQEEPGVVMVGRLRAETVSALLLWGLQDRANSVALAPVSAVLRAAKD